jgi:hypothetical protein
MPAQHQLMRGDLGIGRNFALGHEVKAGGFHGNRRFA